MPLVKGMEDTSRTSSTTDYFEEIGLLDGMTPYITDIYTWTPFDGNFGEVCTTTQSLNQFADTGAGISYIGFNLDATYSRVFTCVYGRGDGFIQIGTQSTAVNAASDISTSYIFSMETPGADSNLYRRVLALDTTLQTNPNVFQASSADTGSWGLATYIEGASPPAVGNQQCFTRNTMEQWWPVAIDNDAIDSNAAFRSVILRVRTGGARFTLPFCVWVGN